MNKKTYISIFLSLILITSCVKEVSQPIDPELLGKLKLLPLEPQNIIYLNLKKIKKNQYWMKKFPTEDSFKVFTSLFEESILPGLNFEQDIDEIIIATEWNNIKTWILTLRDTSVFTKIKFDSLNQIYFYRKSPKDIILSNDRMRIEEIRAGNLDLTFLKNPLYRRMVNTIHYKDQFWFLTRNSKVLLKLFQNGNNEYDEKLANLFSSINFINISINLDKLANINSHWECADEYRAQLLNGLLNGIVSAYILTQPNDPLTNKLGTTEISTNEKSVELNLKLNRNEFEVIKNSEVINKLKRILKNDK